ncbi:ANKRD52 [Mytilus edulis]|uniref:ANKRD52 n=1 Tax=Mytilus edulis TaxID=6550 RepID=A0A8S3UR90_MYTED|nr:ANKRD52 [Mytilus edulis]
MLNAMFCDICQKHKLKNNFVKPGSTNFRKSAVVELEKVHEKTDNAMCTLFRNAYFIAKENLPLDKFQSLNDLNKFNGAVITSKLYQENNACSEFIQTISDSIEQEVKFVSPAVGIMIDESTDLADCSNCVCQHCAIIVVICLHNISCCYSLNYLPTELQITKNPQFEKLSDKLNMKECNLLSKDLAYKNSEKLKIASCHMDQEHVHNLSRETISGLDMFPFLCDMFGKSDNKDMKMFEWPIQYFEEQFDQMQYQNEECFLGLGLLVIYNDTIKINVFKDESIDTVFKKIFKEVFESLELSNRPSKLQVLRKLDTLIDTYITSYIENNQSIITSKHDIVFDLLSLYFGKKMTKTLVKYATPDFISDRIQFESLEEEHDEYTIMIPPYLEHSYFNRMEEEIMKIIFMIWPLYLSSMNGCSIFVQFLLEQQKNIPSELLQDISDRTRFEIAAHDSDTEDIDTDSDMYKITHKNAPLVEACTEGHLQIVQTLVQYGYDIDCVKPGLLSPLYAACSYGHTDIVQYLLGCNCAVDLENCDGQTALHVACIKNNPEIVSILLGKGLYINKPGFCKETPFFIACKWGNLGVVNILLEYNCDITICNNMNESPLHEACKNGHKDIVEVLIRNKCDVDMVNLFGRTALHEACSSNYTQFLDEEDETWSIEGEEVDIQYDEPKVQYGKTVIVDKISDSIETIRKELCKFCCILI